MKENEKKRKEKLKKKKVKKMKTRKVFFKIQKANLIGCTGSSEFWKVI
jgi:hypothetical protein